MPRGLNRTGDFRKGTPIDTTTHNFGNVVNWAPAATHFGNPVPAADPTQDSNPVNWAPSPDHFGNTITDGS